jgi:hypothetical protein
MKTFEDLFSIKKPPVSEEELQTVESEIGIEIPISLRELYKINNGGYAGPHETSYKIYHNAECIGGLNIFYDIENLKTTYLHTLKGAEAAGLGDFGSNRFIAFSDWGACFICIGYTENDLGKIFLIDTGDPIDEINFPIFKLADSLEEFFDGLRPSE